MDRVAVFVDAGYVFAAGSEVLLGEKKTRAQLELDPKAAATFLSELARELSGLPLLRIYWYDGTSSGPTPQHRALADTDNIKVRLGLVNKQGEQKGVDSLIVTDMINLARNGAMASAVLVTGDEDIRVGVQQAQEFGARVHLVSVQAPGKYNQSPLLVQEADELRELTEDNLRRFLSVRSPPVIATVEPDDGSGAVPVEIRVARAVWNAIDATRREQMKAALGRGEKTVPPDVDRILIAAMRQELGRELEFNDKRGMRDALKAIACEP